MNYYNLKLHNTTIRKEIISGIMTFIAMSYILAVNPRMLQTVGMDPNGVFIATVTAIIITTLVGAFYTKMPLAYAPSMSMNVIVLSMTINLCNYDWPMVMLATYMSGVIIVLIVFLGQYDRIEAQIPPFVKYSIMAGIGLAIIRMGAESLGILTISSWGIALHSLWKKEVIFFLISCCVVHIRHRKKKKDAIAVGLLTIYLLAAVSELIVYIRVYGTDIHPFLDICMSNGITLDSVVNVAYRFPNMEEYFTDYTKLVQLAVLVFSITLLHFFDAYGTVSALLLNVKEGDMNFDKKAVKKSIIINAIGSIVSGCTGTTSVTSSAENVIGISCGGKTGVSAIVVCICFGVAFFFAPLFSIMSRYIAAPVMIYVGFIFIYNLKRLKKVSRYEQISAGFIFLYTGLTYQLGQAVCLGLVINIILKLITKRRNEITGYWILVAVVSLISLAIMFYC